MPWTVGDVEDHIKGLSDEQKAQWVAVANSALSKCEKEGGENCDASAIRQANAVVSTKEAVHPHGDHACVCSECGKEITVSAGEKCNEQKCPDCSAPMVAQTAGEKRESAQSLLGNLISEAGRHRMTPRVSKAIETLTKDISGGMHKGTVIEARSCLEWLKAQDVVKTEEGQAYPASAFALVPDSAEPSTWKLRLWEGAGLSKPQLARAAAALSPGGFRGQRVELAANEASGVKARIRAGYRSLEVPDEDIPKWVKEAEMRQYVNESMEIPLSEVTAEGIAQGILPVRILQPGFNKEKQRYYTESAVKDCVKVFENTKMYANHPTKTEQSERPERDIRDWVATLRNVKVSGQGNAIGEAHIHSGWLKEMVSNLQASGTLNQLGTSIRTVGKGVRQMVENVNTLVVEGLIEHPFRSVDFVTEAGAGGQAGVSESLETLDLFLVDLQQLRESRPDLIKLVEEAIKSQTVKETKRMSELEATHVARITELEGQLTTVTQERDTLKATVTEAEKAQKVATAQATIKEAVAKATLPEPAKAKLIERFAQADTAEGIEEAIKGEVAYISEITEAGKPKGMGRQEPKPTGEELRESFKRLHPEWTDEQIEIAVTGR